MEELTLPIATLIASETVETDNESHYKDICEKVKHIRDQVSEFYETESEFNEAIGPIEQDPQSFTSGKPILKKYAHALLEKMEHERQLEAEEEAKQLTPQQVKADLKHYVDACEKKIAQQQEQCDTLQKQVEQLMDVVKVLVTYPHLHKPYDNLLSHCAMVDSKSLDYFISNIKIEGEHTSSLHYAIDSKNIESVKKLLNAGADVNHMGSLLIYNGLQEQCPKHKYEQGNYTPLEIASRAGSLEIVKLLIERGASITLGRQGYKVPNGPEGDLVAGYLQTHGSKPVMRFK